MNVHASESSRLSQANMIVRDCHPFTSCVASLGLVQLPSAGIEPRGENTVALVGQDCSSEGGAAAASPTSASQTANKPRHQLLRHDTAKALVQLAAVAWQLYTATTDLTV